MRRHRQHGTAKPQRTHGWVLVLTALIQHQKKRTSCTTWTSKVTLTPWFTTSWWICLQHPASISALHQRAQSTSLRLTALYSSTILMDSWSQRSRAQTFCAHLGNWILYPHSSTHRQCQPTFLISTSIWSWMKWWALQLAIFSTLIWEPTCLTATRDQSLKMCTSDSLIFQVQPTNGSQFNLMTTWGRSIKQSNARSCLKGIQA